MLHERRDDIRMRVAEHHRGAAHRVVDVLAALDIPLACAEGPVEVRGVGRQEAAVVRHAAGEGFLCTGPQLLRHHPGEFGPRLHRALLFLSCKNVDIKADGRAGQAGLLRTFGEWTWT
jgi:hypothetical protein